jgi:vitamin B12 transporter
VATDALKLAFTGQYVDASSDFDDADFIFTGLPIDADRVSEANRTYLSGDAQYDPAGSRWSGSFAINWSDSDNDNFYDGAWDSSTGAEVLELRARASVLLGDSAVQNHCLTFAVDQENTDFKQRGTATPYGDPNQDQHYHDSGYAAEYVGQPVDGFTWTLSGRVDDFSDFDNVFTWQLAASQHVTDSLKLRGSVGTGSKAPTFTERFGYYPDYFIGNPDLKPEQSSGWELGLDSDLGRDGLNLGLTYFDQTLKTKSTALCLTSTPSCSPPPTAMRKAIARAWKWCSMQTSPKDFRCRAPTPGSMPPKPMPAVTPCRKCAVRGIWPASPPTTIFCKAGAA